MKLGIPRGEEIFLRLEVKDVRKSQFCEILQDNLIAIEQTQPPLDPPHLQHTVLLTYKTHEESPGRLGFDARIEEFTADYRILMRQLSDPAPCDLRVWPRIRLDLFPEIKAFCQDKEIQVIDISGGGTHIIVQKDDCAALEIAMIVKMKFVFEKGEVAVEGKILRTWKDFFQKDHLAIQFQGNNNISQFIY
jgi:hypothetical protein